MRVAELVLAYVRVLVWPLLVAVLAVMFRSRVHHLFERMNRVDAFGASIEFAQSVGAAREALAAALSPGEEGPSGTSPTRPPDGLEREPSVAAAAQQALAGVPAWRWPPGRSTGLAMIEAADLRQARDALATAMDSIEEAFGPLTRGSASQLAIRTGMPQWATVIRALDGADRANGLASYLITHSRSDALTPYTRGLAADYLKVISDALDLLVEALDATVVRHQVES